MKSILVKFWLYNFLLLILLGLGCGKEKGIGSGEHNDSDAIKAIMNEYPTIFMGDIFDSQIENPFYRQITKNEYWVKIDIKQPLIDTLYTDYANVDMIDSIKGVFHLFANQKEYQKNFKGISVVRAYLEKWGDDSEVHRGWLLKKVTGSDITTLPDGAGFYKIKLTSPTYNYTLYPSSATLLTLLKNILTLHSGDSLSLEIEPIDTLDLFYLHFWKGGRFYKRPFVKDTLGHFVTGCQISGTGYQHLFFDNVHYQISGDSLLSYKSHAWGALFNVK